MALKSIVRSITIAIEDDETRKVKGFVQADIVANKAMIHSLIGNKVKLLRINFSKRHQLRELHYSILLIRVTKA